MLSIPGLTRTCWGLMEGQKRRYLAAMVALLASTLLLYLAPMISQVIIDGILLPESDRVTALTIWTVDLLGGREYLSQNLWLPASLVVLVTIAAGVFTYLWHRWTATSSEQIARQTRDLLHAHMQELPCTFYDGNQTGDLIQRCTSDIDTLQRFMKMQVVEIGNAAMLFLIPIPIMLMINVPMTFSSLVALPVILGFAGLVMNRIRSGFRLKEEAEARLTSTVQENLTGIRVVRSYARQEFEQEKFRQCNQTHRELDYKLYILFGRYWGVSDALCFMQITVVIIMGGLLISRGSLEPGGFYFFLTVVTMFLWPVRQIGRIVADMGKTLVAIDRIRYVLDQEQELEPTEPKSLPLVRGAITFSNVSFSHQSRIPVLDDVSFQVEPGQVLALIGPSGCGKSTIVNLLLRFYDYERGSITIDGVELNRIPRKDVRRAVSVVMQEPFLYSRSIGDNIRLGTPAARECEMLDATNAASIHQSIERFEQGYETIVGERGVTLSGGQRQRIAIARAILGDPPVLVLDDALSAVDTDTESLILKALEQRHGNATTIVIAHRLSTLMHADRILVMDGGRIIQAGTHAELRNQDGLYSRLWDIQSMNEDDREDMKP